MGITRSNLLFYSLFWTQTGTLKSVYNPFPLLTHFLLFLGTCMHLGIPINGVASIGNFSARLVGIIMSSMQKNIVCTICVGVSLSSPGYSHSHSSASIHPCVFCHEGRPMSLLLECKCHSIPAITVAPPPNSGGSPVQ